jgi:hypothetical protein
MENTGKERAWVFMVDRTYREAWLQFCQLHQSIADTHKSFAMTAADLATEVERTSKDADRSRKQVNSSIIIDLFLVKRSCPKAS